MYMCKDYTYVHIWRKREGGEKERDREREREKYTYFKYKTEHFPKVNKPRVTSMHFQKKIGKSPPRNSFRPF